MDSLLIGIDRSLRAWGELTASFPEDKGEILMQGTNPLLITVKAKILNTFAINWIPTFSGMMKICGTNRADCVNISFNFNRL